MIEITSLNFPLGKESEVIFILLVIQGEDLAVQAVKEIEHGCP